MTIHTALLIALIALQIADGYTTIQALRTGKAREANGLVAKLMDKIGRDVAVVGLKVLVVVALVYYRLSIPLWMLAGLTAVYVVVVARNIGVLRKLRK